MLYESPRTRILRVRRPDGGPGVVIKEPRGPAAAHRLRQERAVLARLAGIDGVPQLVDGVRPAGSLVLADSGATALATRLDGTPLAPTALLDLGHDIARVLADVHRAGVVHKDVNPANILVSEGLHRPTLIDFHLATTSVEDRPGFTPAAEIPGTLPYLAPEQTGRTGRRVDQRSDLYSLGATLYELATGRPPFGRGEPLQMVSDHLAQEPQPPTDVDARVPRDLSDVIMRLLRKDPDRRYQSADGLVHDLALLRDRKSDAAEPFTAGSHDVSHRLAPPSTLVGREPEIAALRGGFADALHGRGRGMLVAGGPGVGKSALIDELRPAVTANGGWLIGGKFDQYRQDPSTDAVWQALRALGRLLLAEPERDRAAQRQHIRQALGANAGLLTAMVPEFATLLSAEPESTTGDAVTAERRLRRACIDLLRAVVSPVRPLVVVLEDLQWAGPMALALIDALQTDGSLRRLFVVGSYRESEVGASHPLAVGMARWEGLGSAPALLRLENLGPDDLADLLGRMLRVGPEKLTDLAPAIGARTGGNPYDTIELVQALSRRKALTPAGSGWDWDPATVREQIGTGDVVDLLCARIDALPAQSRELLEVMACLGGEVELRLLQVAGGRSPAELDEHLAPALEDGLLAPAEGTTVRFAHDRVQQAAYGRVEPDRRRDLQLGLARRLAAVPEFAAVAAEQYLPAAHAIPDADELRRVAELFRHAATSARRVNPMVAEPFLTAAVTLLETVETAEDGPMILDLELERHAVLYDLGRHEDVDHVYWSVERRVRDPLHLAHAACVQVSSLLDRGRQADGVTLGLTVLARLGLDTSDEAIATQSDEQWTVLYEWIEALDPEAEVRRPPVTSVRVEAIGDLLVKMVTPAFFLNARVVAWLVLQAHQLWAAHGPTNALVGTMSMAAPTVLTLRRDHTTANKIARNALAIAELRGYEPATSLNRHMYAMFTAHWFEPLENAVTQAQQAREGLHRVGLLQSAAFTHNTTLGGRLETTPSIDALDDELATATAFAAATGNATAGACYVAYRQLLRALRGQTLPAGGFTDSAFDEKHHLDQLPPIPESVYRVNRALAAAIFGDQEALATHTAAALPLIAPQNGYRTALLRALHALALAHQIRGEGDRTRRAALRMEFTKSRNWLDERAADAPENYRHLVHLLDAELAWAEGDPATAVRVFDAALREAGHRQRPWHRALITERAALCHLAGGLEHTGRGLLAEARDAYRAWGATAKVAQLHRTYPALRASGGGSAKGRGRGATAGNNGTSGNTSISADSIDLVAVLDAARALSAETDVERLRERVVESLVGLTGASTARLLLRDEQSESWLLPEQGGAVPVTDPSARTRVPLSAVRYVDRTGETLLVEDATRDHRFAREPYLSGLDRCALLVVPILNQGTPLAMLLLENRLASGTFSTDRLDAVMLIAGQLTVSLQNALAHAALERQLAERTRELELANERLAVLAVTDPLTGLANRRRLVEFLETELLQAVRAGSRTGVMMIDIDHFKAYNDGYGHLAGDACLRRVAAALNESVRGTDLIARYGGEEFAVVMPRTDAAGARLVAERARAAVEALQEPHTGAPSGIVTVSIGITSHRASKQTTAQHLLAAADTHLFEAKREGRNKVHGEDPVGQVPIRSRRR
ncbi:serine/threonine protein kinase [Virgisporangium aliadipatigenens]|uniref:Serine/threonine protein kinase n=1 Tax=Virgisporangium aliadipatigenens TaxID=741659 RepID=A0A8J4DTB1_9ACTN|nr:serine/threonine protein kinase [Virgisporangium aliadipatigenens]